MSPSRRRDRWILGLASVLLVAGPGWAAPAAVPDFVLKPVPDASPSPWQVTGRVMFRSTPKASEPAAGIEVFLTNADGRVVDRGQTGKDGHYLLSAPKPGIYEVRVDQSAATRRRGHLLAPFKQVVILK